VLIQGSGGPGDWLGHPTFDVVAPAGYELDPTFGRPDPSGDGNDQGYLYDTTADTFYVQLIAAPIEAPEPSTYGLLGLGLLALLAIGRFRRLAT